LKDEPEGDRKDGRARQRTGSEQCSHCFANFSGILGLRLRGLPIAVRRKRQVSSRLHFFMYLLYLDDAGSAQNKLEPYFVLGGICIFEAQADWLRVN
jgi:hypothetical protein